ncbi:UNVERIFIED_CONTAM: hypothetical protein FKN15_014527 [Acipenser sinensis]
MSASYRPLEDKGQPCRCLLLSSLRLASRVRCSAMRRNSPAGFILPSPRENQSQRDAPFGILSEDRPTSHNQDANLCCMTHPARHTAALLPGGHLYFNISTSTDSVKLTRPDYI